MKRPKSKLFLLKAGVLLVLVAVLLGSYIQHANRPIDIVIPEREDPPNNAFEDFQLVMEQFPQSELLGPHSDSRDVDSWTVEELREFSDVYQEFFSNIRNTLAGRPYVIPRSQTLPFNEMSHHPRARATSLRLTSEVYYRVRIEDYPSAAEYMALGMDIGIRYGKGGVFVDHMVGGAILALAAIEFDKVVPNLQAEDLRKLAASLDVSYAGRPLVHELFEEEKYYTVDSLNKYLDEYRGPFRPILAAFEMGNSSGFEDEKRSISIVAPLRFLFEDKRKTLQDIITFYDSWTEAVKEPYRPDFSFPTSTYHEVLYGDRSANDMNNSLFRIHSNYDALFQVLRTEIALRIYEKEQGRYPEHLDDLVPTYLPAVPIDPMAQGKPLSYRSLDDGRDFLLYSFGGNSKDNGGTPGHWRSPEEDADIVAGKWQRSDQSSDKGE